MFSVHLFFLYLCISYVFIHLLDLFPRHHLILFSKNHSVCIYCSSCHANMWFLLSSCLICVEESSFMNALKIARVCVSRFPFSVSEPRHLWVHRPAGGLWEPGKPLRPASGYQTRSPHILRSRCLVCKLLWLLWAVCTLKLHSSVIQEKHVPTMSAWRQSLLLLIQYFLILVLKKRSTPVMF